MNEACAFVSSPKLNLVLIHLSIDVLAELVRIVRIGLNNNIARTTDEYSVWEWTIVLATLAADVGELVHILTTHDSSRASMILNRSLSEYQLRLRYYIKHPDHATQDLSMFETEMRSAMMVRPIEEFEQRLEPGLMSQVSDFLAGNDVRIPRRQIKQMFREIYGDKADLLYNLHYGIASAFAHGKVLATGDVLRRSDPSDPTAYTYHRKTNVFSLNSALGESVGHLLSMLELSVSILKVSTSVGDLRDQFRGVLAVLEPDRA